MAEICCESDCILPTHAGGLRCAGHAKQVQLGKTAAPLREKLPLRERVLKLVNDLADCDSENDSAYEAAWDALRKALERWAREGMARRNALRRWAGTTPAERTAFASKIASARWRGVQASKHQPVRHRVPRAGKRRGEP